MASNSRAQDNTACKIPPCPALIDILELLENVKRAYFDVPDSNQFKIAASLVEQAAKKAYKDNLPFTKKYAADFIDDLGPKQSIRDCFHVLVNQLTDSGVRSYGEIVGLFNWVCTRINRLTGVRIHEVQKAAGRSDGPLPLDFEYGSTDCDLSHVGAKLRELDRNRQTEIIWRRVWNGSSLIRDAITGNADSAAKKNGQVAAAPTPNGNAPKPSEGTPGKPNETKRDQTAADPFVPLTSWSDIFAALNEPHGNATWKNNETTREKIRKLNINYSGPIKLPVGKGTQPSVDKAKLLQWWNGLKEHFDARIEETAAKESSTRSTVASHKYGASGEVVPNIGGSVRRKKGKERKK